MLVAVGVVGIAFTTTAVVPAKLVHPATVLVTEYVPAEANAEEAIVGFCKADVKVLGPVQE